MSRSLMSPHDGLIRWARRAESGPSTATRVLGQDRGPLGAAVRHSSGGQATWRLRTGVEVRLVFGPHLIEKGVSR